MMMPSPQVPPKIAFRPQDEGGYIVFMDGDRLGFVRQVGGEWAATDTYHKPLRSSYETRKRAVAALLRRHAKESQS